MVWLILGLGLPALQEEGVCAGCCGGLGGPKPGGQAGQGRFRGVRERR